MNLVIVIGILFSHILAAYPFALNLQKGKMPNTAHFAVISIILYYDFGLLIETLGWSVGNSYFIPFFDASPWIVVTAVSLLVLAPWLFLLGSQCTNKETRGIVVNNNSHLKKSTKTLFYITLISISVCFAVMGLNEVFQHDSLWGARVGVTEKWGPFILLLYMPLHFLAFYTKQSDSSSKQGLMFSCGLTLATILSTISIAQRTTLLLPILILVLFRKQISIKKIVIFLSIAIIAASSMLPFFKAQKQDSQDISGSIGVLIAETIEADFYRGGVLVSALDNTALLGTKIMPYVMSGYIYSLLFYVPREIAPFKDWSTSQTFTAVVDNTRVEETKWGFGVGVIEELLLNIGLVGTVPCLFIYGMGMGLFDKLSIRIPSLLIPIRLAAIWLCGYESSVLLFTFGTMAGVAFGLYILFGQKATNKNLAIELYRHQQ